MESSLQALAYLLSALVLAGYLFYVRKKQGFLIPKKPSKKPKYWRKKYYNWLFPDYSAYPVPSLIGIILKGVIIVFVLLIVWLLLFAEIPH
jgi:hypothetical protein